MTDSPVTDNSVSDSTDLEISRDDAIVRVRFTEKQPRTAWNVANASEYGFFANVNPEVDHPRWSQAKERRIGEFRRRETLMFNGYGQHVASMYAGMDLRKQY